jgi:hypothetical protein
MNDLRTAFLASHKQHSSQCTRRSRPALPALALAAVLILAACSSDSTTAACVTPDAAVSDTLDITIFGSTISMTESGVSLNTVVDMIEVFGAESVAGSTAGKFVSLGLPSNATAGTYTSADSATIFYAENFNFADSSSTLGYGSTSPTITVDSAGAVGCLWTGTFSGDMVDISGGGAPTTATGSFSTVREVDGFTE